MKKLLVSAFALAAMASTAMAAEPLTTSQLDKVTAGLEIEQVNVNVTKQRAVAVNRQKCVVAICTGGAAAANYNSTAQFNID